MYQLVFTLTHDADNLHSSPSNCDLWSLRLSSQWASSTATSNPTTGCCARLPLLPRIQVAAVQGAVHGAPPTMRTQRARLLAGTAVVAAVVAAVITAVVGLRCIPTTLATVRSWHPFVPAWVRVPVAPRVAQVLRMVRMVLMRVGMRVGMRVHVQNVQRRRAMAPPSSRCSP